MEHFMLLKDIIGIWNYSTYILVWISDIHFEYVEEMIIGLLLKNEKSSLPTVCFIFFLTAHFHTTFFDRFHGRKRIEFGLETIFLLDNNIGFCFEYRVCCKNLTKNLFFIWIKGGSCYRIVKSGQYFATDPVVWCLVILLEQHSLPNLIDLRKWL